MVAHSHRVAGGICSPPVPTERSVRIFYPVTPGIPRYALGSPLFNDAVIHLPGGKSFQIVVHRDSANAPYIQSALLNGKPLSRFWLKHREIMQGGLLVVNMSAHPNRGWPSAMEQVN